MNQVLAVVVVRIGRRRAIIAGCGEDGLIRLRDAGTGVPVGFPLAGHEGPVLSMTSVHVNAGVVLATGGQDGTIRLWDLASSQPVGTPLRGHRGGVRALTCVSLPDGRTLIASGGDDGTALLWDAATGEPAGSPLTGHRGRIFAMVAVTSGESVRLVTAGQDGEVRRWDAIRGEQVGDSLKLHGGPVLALAPIPGTGADPLIASAGSDGTIRRWHLSSGQEIGQRLAVPNGRLLSVAAAPLPGGKILLASGGDDGLIRRWDALEGCLLGEPLDAPTDGVWALAAIAQHDGSVLLVSGGEDGEIQRWDGETGAALPGTHSGHTGRVLAIAGTNRPHGDRLLVSASEDGTLRRWDGRSGEPIGEPLVGHAGRVLCVRLIARSPAEPLLVSGGEDGLIRQWDAVAGAALGVPLAGHEGPVLAMTSVHVNGGVVLATGGQDGTIRLWDLASSQPVGTPLRGHRGGVRALTCVSLPDGRTLIASGGDDGTALLWDAATGEPAGSPLIGHAGTVRALAAVVLPEGGGRLVSAGQDGALRLWEPVSGRPLGAPLTGHSGPVLCVDSVVLPNGCALFVSGGHDGSVRRWDASTGAPVGQPFRAHNGPVVGVAVLPQAIDVPRMATVGGDGTLGIWPLSDADEVIALFPHPTVSSQVDDFTAPSGAMDDTDELPIVPGQRERSPASPAPSAGPGGSSRATPDSPIPMRPQEDARALTLVDREGVNDELGREILASHLDGLLSRLSTEEEGGRAVVHLDGTWGSGKSTLIELLLDPRRAQLHPAPRRAMNRAVVVRYDAWRESSVSPEWWSLAAAIHRAVREERAWATRWLMSLIDVGVRIMRAPSVLVSAVFLMAVLIGNRAGWWGDLKALGDALTVLATVLAIGLSAGRALFWTSPLFGRLYFRNDDNPLGEIAAAIARLRRWSPVQDSRHRAADTLLGVWVLVTLSWGTRIVASGPSRRNAIQVPEHVSGHAVALLVAATAGIIAVGLKGPAVAATGPEHPRANQDERQARDRRSLPEGLAENAAPMTRSFTPLVSLLLGGLAAVLVFVVLTTPTPRPFSGWAETHPKTLVLGLLSSGLLLHGIWIAWSLDVSHRRREGAHPQRGRRPILVIIDDLDRCAADRVVRLMETVHTLLREPASTTTLPRWRSPAALVVLVVGDGRWIRQAFETSFAAFSPLGSSVHGLGADFCQKIFDHLVLVPPLSPGQLRNYLEVLTEPRSAATGLPVAVAWARHPESGDGLRVKVVDPVVDLRRISRAQNLIDTNDSTLMNTPELDEQLDAIGDERERVSLAAQRARKATDEKAINAVRQHLLMDPRYTSIMPRNPRLVKRVANAYGMVRALRDHVGHRESDDVMIRAATLLVRFPSLIDDLLFAPEPPSIAALGPPTTSGWQRGDVRQVVGTCSPESLARCFGREFPVTDRAAEVTNRSPDVTETPTHERVIELDQAEPRSRAS